MITCIIKILTTPQAAAELCLSVFGEGTANPDSDIIEGFLAYCMTPVQNGYARVLMGSHYADALQYLMDTYYSTDIEVISIELNGQAMFDTGYVDDLGNNAYLGFFSGHPVYAEEVV